MAFYEQVEAEAASIGKQLRADAPTLFFTCHRCFCCVEHVAIVTELVAVVNNSGDKNEN